MSRAVVDVESNSWVAGAIDTWEADGAGWAVCARASNVDVCARHVELSTTGSVGIVESNDFNTHEVVSRSNTARDSKVGPSVVVDHGIHTPDTTLETIAVNLEPLEASCTSCAGIVNLGKVDLDGTFVALCDWVVSIIGSLRSTDDVLPPGTDAGASWDSDYSGRDGANETRVAGNGGARDICDGVVGARSADSYELALISAIDAEFLEDRVGVSADGEKERHQSKSLHPRLDKTWGVNDCRF